MLKAFMVQYFNIVHDEPFCVQERHYDLFEVCRLPVTDRIIKKLMNFARIFWWDGMCDEQQLIRFFNSKDGMIFAVMW